VKEKEPGMTAIQTHAPIAVVDDLGTGEPALLLLPGWCGDRTVFEPLLTSLGGARRVVAADLRGQGARRRESADFSAADQVEDLLALLAERGIDRVIPVTIAHAGWFALELRRRLGARRVPGVVLLDWMVLGTPPGFGDALHGLQDPKAWQQVRAALFGMWTAGVDSPAVHEYVTSMGSYGYEHWRRAGREIHAAFDAEGSPLAALGRLEPACPTLHLYAQPADDGYLAAQEAVAREHEWYAVRRLPASSHFPMLEVPDAMAPMIEEFASSLT
jgi:pimeloyl-ACP methyl ester carboxylesterase